MIGVDRALTDADYLRRSPFLHGGKQGHKEWWHFCIYGEDLDVLVNFSLVDDVRPGAPAGQEFARITVLVRAPHWDGEVETIDARAVEADGGGLSFRFGDNLAEYRDGAYHLRVRMKRRPIAIDLRVVPEALPSLANNIQLDAGPPIHWMVLPRATAEGTVTYGGTTFTLRDAPAYHDHNWGHFAWGRDFAWEWGFGLPADRDNPWSFVFVRLSDRAHTRALMQAVFLWKGPYQHRVLRASDLTVRREGLLRAERVYKVPRVMGLVSPSTATDVPARLVMEAHGDGDHLDATFTASDLAQVIIPNDHDAGNTIIHEVNGTLSLDGEVRGERVTMRGRAVFEFLGA